MTFLDMNDAPSPAGRRSILKAGMALGAAGFLGGRMRQAQAAGDAATVTLPFSNGVRPIVAAGTFPEKGEMILQRTRAPLLETPWDVFQKNLFTPNDRAFVRWHMADFPNSVDTASYKIKVFGAVDKPFELRLNQLVAEFPATHMAAVNQCSGNSRGFESPRVAGAQWAHGAMFNAMWTGVALKKLLEKAGLKADATHVAFRSLETGVPPYPPSDRFEKVLPLARANDGEAMLAYEMNGAQMPLLNGFPVRLVVPGWYSTYWVKMLTEIEVMNHPGTGFWMATAYKIPDTPDGSMTPGQANVKMVPINKMKPRSFITGPDAGANVASGKKLVLKGFAFGGSSALKSVMISTDGGKSWRPAALGKNWGAYGYRAWQANFTPPKPGTYTVMVKAANVEGVEQQATAAWNPGGFMYNAIEHIDLQAS